MAKKPQEEVKHDLKESIFRFLDFPHSKDFLARFVAFWLILASISSGLTAILETEGVLKSNFNIILIIIEIISGSVFILEYILRLWVSSFNPEYKNYKIKPFRYVISLMGIIDLVSVVSFILFLIFLFEQELMNAIILIRLLPFLKMIRYSESFEIIWTVIKRKKEELLISLMLSLLLMFFSAVFMYIAEYDAQPDDFTNLFSSMWFTAINLFTIGYGDMVPITPFGKFVSAIVSFLGITLFLLPASVIASGFVDEIQERNPQYDVCPNCNKKFDKDKFLKDIHKKREGKPSGIVMQILEAEKSKTLPILTSHQRVQHKFYNLFQYRYPKSKGQIIVFLFFSVIIVLNVLAIMVETNPNLSQELRSILVSVYFFSGVVFIIEYTIRFWSCTVSEQEEYQDRNNRTAICTDDPKVVNYA